jgi:uncharacterized membrane-anchored protein YitT (DUF2179 family)
MIFFPKKHQLPIKTKQQQSLQDYLLFIIGVLMVAVSFNLFILPSKIVYGGVRGISIITSHLFKLEPALFIFYTSIFLLVGSFILLGKEKTFNSILGSLLYPIFVGLTANIRHYIVLDNTDVLLMAIFGGLITGLGSGLTFKTGFTTGGTDIICQIIYKYFKISIGQATLIVDGLIILGGSMVFGWEIAMYGIIVIYIISTITDKVLLGTSSNKALYIVTTKEKEVQTYILETLHRRVTILDAEGGFTGQSKKVLMCVIPTNDYFKLTEGLRTIDDKAFFVVTDAYEVSKENENINNRRLLV